MVLDKTKRVIAIDVDLTVVDVVFGNCNNWFDWCLKACRSYDKERLQQDMIDGTIQYGLYDYFEFDDHVDPMDFWRQEDLYEYAKPYVDAINSIKLLSEDLGLDIVFVSYCKAKHYKSKFEMIHRHLPYDGFIATKAKGFVHCDYFVDDRNMFLNQVLRASKDYGKQVHCYRIKTPYAQCEEPLEDYFTGSWVDIVNDIARREMSRKLEEVSCQLKFQ